MNKAVKVTLIVASIFAMLSVAIGAFAAHALKASLEPYALSIIETGARYQMFHALALMALASLSLRLVSLSIVLPAFCFSIGIVCFSGSLYLLALTSIKWVVFVTPLGGLLFIIGWCSVIYIVLRHTNTDAKDISNE
jgi:uncharacterized membrane protein YgdD (TMEM256/DUF423 family)